VREGRLDAKHLLLLLLLGGHLCAAWQQTGIRLARQRLCQRPLLLSLPPLVVPLQRAVER
jgi:hypothetical protein